MTFQAKLASTVLFFGLAITSGYAQENPRHVVLDSRFTSVKTLDQNWTDAESNWFYDVPQGSRLVPYQWFIQLEQSDSEEKFVAPQHIRELGYIPRTPSTENPDGLPIGFTSDVAYEDGTPGLGITCAACHTGQIIHGNVAYLVDGAPTMGDFERLLKEITRSLESTIADEGKFNRFASAILEQDATENMQNDLRASLRSIAAQRREYNERNLPQSDLNRFGHGRVDAFGAIFNEVSTTFLGVAGNAAAANAPVSYPCLWDAPQHDRVQWNGAAENRTSELGSLLFGAKEVGALGRNSGEVLGVFGHVQINDGELILPRRYSSTVHKANLLKIEDSLKRLWSPLWPAEFGAVNEARRQRGADIYVENCADCHHSIVRDSPDRKVEAQIYDVKTDSKMLINFGRVAATGKLQRRRISLLGRERFAAEAPVGVILKHVVERSMLNDLDLAQIREAISAIEVVDVDSLNPGYKNTAIVQIGETQIRVPLDALSTKNGSIEMSANKAELLEFARGILRSRLAEAEAAAVDLDSLDAILDQLGDRLTMDRSGNEEASASAEVAGATASFGYKARPLNGVWATAPYLHNGSVATLAELLMSPSNRKQQFHVGSQVFDPVNVGFMDDPEYPMFDTAIEGNSNTGHDHGGTLTAEEKLDLIEYLKSL